MRGSFLLESRQITACIPWAFWVNYLCCTTDGEGETPPPNTNCATSMVNSFSTFPIQSQKNTTTSSSKHITKDFPYPCLCSVLKHPLLLCLPKSYLPIGTTVGTFSESESLPGELDIISPNSGWGGSLLPVSL